MVQAIKKSPICKLVGNTNEAIVKLGGVECLALIDTGSMVCNISEMFYREFLQYEFPLQDLDRILQIEGAAGQLVSYLGYIEVDIAIPGTSIEVFAPVLVVPDTEYSKEIPLLIGTNVLKVIEEKKQDTGPNQIWKSSLECLVRNESSPSSFTVYACREIVIPSNQAVVITGMIGGRCSGDTGILEAVDSLPGGLLMPLSAVEVEQNRVRVQIKNISVRDIRIPAKQKIAQFQPGAILGNADIKFCKPEQVQRCAEDVPVKLEGSCLTETQRQEVRGNGKTYLRLVHWSLEN